MLTQKTKILAAVSISSLLAVAAAVAVMLFFINKQGAVLEDQLAATAAVSAEEQLYRDLARVAETSAADRTALQDYFLNESDTIDFLTLVETVAQKQGVGLTTDALKVIESDDTNAALEVNFSLEGDRVAILEMIQIIETLPYASHIQNLNITKPVDGNSAKASLVFYVILNETYD